MLDIDWSLVIQSLKDEAERLRLTAENAFSNDQKTKDAMYQQARIGEMFAKAFLAGIQKD